MIVAVDTVQMTTALIEPEDCKRFHIFAAGGDVDAVRRALGGCAYPDAHPDAAEGHAWVHVDWVRAQAEGAADPGWAAEFEGMLGYARSKGWLNEAGTAIAAHIEWDAA